jgi:hypothetical protein
VPNWNLRRTAVALVAASVVSTASASAALSASASGSTRWPSPDFSPSPVSKELGLGEVHREPTKEQLDRELQTVLCGIGIGAKLSPVGLLKETGTVFVEGIGAIKVFGKVWEDSHGPLQDQDGLQHDAIMHLVPLGDCIEIVFRVRDRILEGGVGPGGGAEHVPLIGPGAPGSLRLPNTGGSAQQHAEAKAKQQQAEAEAEAKRQAEAEVERQQQAEAEARRQQQAEAERPQQQAEEGPQDSDPPSPDSEDVTLPVDPEPVEAEHPDAEDGPCPNGMVGPGPDEQGHSGCYVRGYEPSLPDAG